MTGEEKQYTIQTFFICTMVVLLAFLLVQCDGRSDEIKFRTDETVRIECIRQGGNWADVRSDKTVGYAEYGCVRK